MKHPFPLLQQDNFSTPWVFSSPDSVYPYPIPETELYPEFPWPKSLCPHAPDCQVKDDFSDLAPVKECIHAYQEGCPIYLTQFNGNFQEFGECNGIELFEIGQTESADYTEEDLIKIVENFAKLKDSHRPPMVVLGHDEDQALLQKSGLPSAGWVSNLWARGKKLVADFKDVPQQIVDIINKGAYRFPSVEIYHNFLFNKEAFGPVLRRVALLGADVPRIKSLDDIVARYGENDCQDSFCLPVDKSAGDVKEKETIWLGGDTMKRKITVPIKSISGDFKVGEEVTNGNEITGILESFDDKNFVINVDSKKDFQDDEKITGTETKAEATVGKKVDPFSKTVVIELNTVEGTFKEGEKVEGVDSKLIGTVQKVEPEKISVFLEVDENFRGGEEITGSDSKAKARVGKKEKKEEPVYPEPSTNTEKALQQLQEQFKELSTKLTGKDAEIATLKTQAQSQETKIQQVETDRMSEKRAVHVKQIQTFSEKMKLKGLAPAIFDELGLSNYLHTLDWQKTFKFAEDEDPVTPFDKFTAILSSMLDRYQENTLFVPLDDLGKVIETEDIIPDGVDEEGAKLDQKITKYAEEKNVSYDEAFAEVMKEENKKK